MAQFTQQKITDLERKLANKIKQLEYEIIALPAYPRRKKDEKNKEVFHTVLAIVALTGVLIFGTGWLAVAILGTVLSVIIVESGLFISLGIGLCGGYLHSAYIGMRDLFSSEKIKIQNKDYDNLQKNLIKLKRLFLIKTSVSKRIKNRLALVKSLGISQLGLNDTLQHLEAIQKNHPAHSRRQRDKEDWKKMSYYSTVLSYFEISLLTITIFLMVVYAPLVLSSFLMAFPLGIILILLLTPMTNALYAGCLWIRDRLHVGRKAENKEYDKLEKIIDELKELSKQQDKLDKIIDSKFQESDAHNLVSAENTSNKSTSDEKQSSEKSLALKEVNNYGPLFKVPHTAENNVDPSFSMRFSNSI